MPARSSLSTLLALELDRSSNTPVYRQLYLQLRDAILASRLTPGSRLPSTRVLASELQVSRTTVVDAVEQLIAEGYLNGKAGAGTFVESSPSGFMEKVDRKNMIQGRRHGSPPAVSRRWASLSQAVIPSSASGLAFKPGIDLQSFPFRIWAKIFNGVWQSPSQSLALDDPLGYQPLRMAIAAYLRATRAMICDADQIIITAGARDAFHLVSVVLLDPGDVVWIEDPGYLGLRSSLISNGARIVPTPVDDNGIYIKGACEADPKPRLIAVAPARQYPLGMTMSLTRRLELLDAASRMDALVLEDDYDSHLYYAGRPPAPLQSLDADERVIYVGSFSQVLFPTLRLGYLIVPPHLVDAFSRARRSLGLSPPIVMQPVVSRFMLEGYFAAHLKRMRQLYASRQEALIEIMRQYLDGALEVVPQSSGTHLVARLLKDADMRKNDIEVSAKAAEKGIVAPALANYYLGKQSMQGILLGYAAVTEEEIKRGVHGLAQALAS